MKHRLQGDKKPLASDGRRWGLFFAQPRGILVLRVVFCEVLVSCVI